jgi:hypothetical protein
MLVQDVLKKISAICHRAVEKQYKILNEDVVACVSGGKYSVSQA